MPWVTACDGSSFSQLPAGFGSVHCDIRPGEGQVAGTCDTSWFACHSDRPVLGSNLFLIELAVPQEVTPANRWMCCRHLQSVGSAPGSASLRPIVLKNTKRVEVHIIPVGASIQRIMVPDKNGYIADVVLGFDSADEYLVRCLTGKVRVVAITASACAEWSQVVCGQQNNTARFGAIAGRVVNRIANATFTLSGTRYQVHKARLLLW